MNIYDTLDKLHIKPRGTIKENSAFDVKLYSPFDTVYFLNYAQAVSNYCNELIRVRPKVYQALDSFDLFYFDLEKLAENLKKPPKTIWQKLVQQLINNEKIQEINKVTKGNTDLSLSLIHI